MTWPAVPPRRLLRLPRRSSPSSGCATSERTSTRDEDESATLVDLLGGDDLAYELVDSRDAIANTWKTLPDVERRVVELRFMHDLSQREIGDRIGYSEMHVSRLLRQALNSLEKAAA